MADVIINELSESAKRRFWEKVLINSPDECWPWTAYVDQYGYGIFAPSAPFKRGETIRSTHVSLFFSGKKRPKGAYALHSCDNPRCCNPKHLRWGSQKDNMIDASKRGRITTTKITKEDALKIRYSNIKGTELAVMFGLSRGQISRIKNGTRWAYLS